MNRLVNILAAAVLAFTMNAAFQRAFPVQAAQNTLIADNALIDQWDGMIAFFPDSCPTGWQEYTNLRGRYVVGVPEMGTKRGTQGTALSDRETRRGGTAHAGPSLSYTAGVMTDGSVSYTRPSVSYTRPTISVDVVHQHMHAFNRVGVNTRLIDPGGTQIGEPSGVSSLLNTAGQSADPIVTSSISGGGVTLSGGFLTYTRPTYTPGSASISGGFADNQPAPAPYIQLTACEYDPA